jgi:hypothetical protein
MSDEQNIARTVVNHVADARGLPAPWPDTDTELPNWLTGRRQTDFANWGAHELGLMRERLASDADRKQTGIWYTPPELAASITRLALSIDSCEPGCDLPGCVLRVLTLDPACGAGVFLIAAAREIARRYAARATGTSEPPAWAVQAVLPIVLTECVYGIDTDPVAVDLARAACWLETGGVQPFDCMDTNIVVGDPLAGALPKALEDRIDDPDPLVIVGNPPYREHAKGAAPWIEQRRKAGEEEIVPRPSLDEFRVLGNGRIENKLSNLWTFFWRWAAWRALESRQTVGTVSLITPSAYLQSRAYEGMREHLRRVSREGWVIDVSPEGHQPPKETRLFPGVRTPLAIGVFTTHSRGGFQEAMA